MADLPRFITGYVVSLGALGAVILLNLLVFRHQWKSYPTLAEYIAAHRDCDRADGAVCHRCKRTPARMRVIGRGRLYRCTWCETELYRVDRDA
jgi:hypothetical protein